MQFPVTMSSLLVLLSVATAVPLEEKRQDGGGTGFPVGGQIFALQTYFSGGGCTGTADTEPTFGGVNLCQSLRTVLPGDIIKSINLTAINPDYSNCVVHYYTDLACTKGDTVAVAGHCEQASAPFLTTNVICPT